MVATAVVTSAVVGGYSTYKAGKEGAAASRDASSAMAAAEMRKQDYLERQNKLPTAMREAIMRGTAGQFGATFDEEGNPVGGNYDVNQYALDNMNPYYERAMAGREEAGLRALQATGGLRSGATIRGIGDIENQTYSQAYDRARNEGLQGLNTLMGGPNYTQDIANSMSSVGGIQADGIMSAGRAQQQKYQGYGDAFSGGINQYLYGKGSGII